MIEVTVGYKDGGAVRAYDVERAQDRCCVTARVDDDGLIRLGRGTHDVRVRPDRAEFELVYGK